MEGSGQGYWARFARARLSRRRLLLGSASVGVGAAALGVLGCSSGGGGGSGGGGQTPSSATQSEGTPKPGGTYTASATGTFAGVDPHNSVYGGATLVPIIYNYLLRKNILAPQEGNIQDLAVSQEAAADNLTWVFKLRNDVVINPNGTSVPARPLDSQDVMVSFQRIMDVNSGSNGYTWTNQWVEKVDAPDANTFRIITKSPYGWVLDNVGNNLYSAIVPKEWITSPDLKTKAIGGGPFLFKEETEGSQAVVVKNPTYYQKGKPYLDSFVIKAFGDIVTQRTAFTSGQIDSYAATDPDEAKAVLATRNDVIYYEEPGLSFDSFWMSVKSAPWSDNRVRRAVSRAINRDEYIQLIGHNSGKGCGLIVPTMTTYALSQDELKSKQQPFNVQDAKQLFSAAGVKDFTFSHPTASNIADYVNIFVRQMQAAGVTAKADPQDAGTWVSNYFQSKLTASLSLNQIYQTPDVALQWFVTGGITGNGHYDTGFSDHEVDTAIQNAATVLDETQRQKAYQDAQRIVYSKDPAMLHFINQPGDTLLIKALKGVHRGVSSLNTAFFPGYWLDR